LRALDPMLPVISTDLGISLSRAALLASSYAFPYAAMQLVLGPIADAIGPREGTPQAPSCRARFSPSLGRPRVLALQEP
jgi:MFS family permease